MLGDYTNMWLQESLTQLHSLICQGNVIKEGGMSQRGGLKFLQIWAQVAHFFKKKQKKNQKNCHNYDQKQVTGITGKNIFN